MGTAIISLALIAIVAAIIIRLAKVRRSGGHIGCDSCSSSGSCPSCHVEPEDLLPRNSGN
jgi:uncharacterized membrane protein